MKTVRPAKLRKPFSKIRQESIQQNVPSLPLPLQEAFLTFLENHPPKPFSHNLRNMLLQFLQYDGATEVLYLQDLLFDLEGLFGLLEDAMRNDQ